MPYIRKNIIKKELPYSFDNALNEGELAKPIDSWSEYFITNQGRIFRKNGKYYGIKEVGYKDKFGYKSLVLRDNGRKKNIRAHTLVWTTFVGDIPKGYCIDHKNNIRDDNRIENLQCVTIAQNVSKDSCNVFYRKERNTWVAMIQINGKKIRKSFKEKENAIKQYKVWQDYYSRSIAV